MTKSSGASTRTSTVSPSPCSVLAGSLSCFSYSCSLGEMSDSCGQWPRGRSLAQPASRLSSTQRYSCSDPSARSALSHISQAWRYSYSRYLLYRRLKRLANCKIHARVGSAISQLITSMHACPSTEPQSCLLCSAIITRCSSGARTLASSVMMLTLQLDPRREIGEPSNRTKQPSHEHSFARQEITTQAQKTMKTRRGFRLVVRVASLSRRLHNVPSLQKLTQESPGDLSGTARINGIRVQPRVVGEPVHRSGIQN